MALFLVIANIVLADILTVFATDTYVWGHCHLRCWLDAGRKWRGSTLAIYTHSLPCAKDLYIFGVSKVLITLLTPSLALKCVNKWSVSYILQLKTALLGPKRFVSLNKFNMWFTLKNLCSYPISSCSNFLPKQSGFTQHMCSWHHSNLLDCDLHIPTAEPTSH